MSLPDTRSQVIAYHVGMALRHTTMVERTYYDRVAELYLERTPPSKRKVDVSAGADPYADSRINTQRYKRMLEGQVRLPADLEEALILALPQPYRGQALRDLGERVGVMVAPLPAATACTQHHHVGDLARAFGDSIKRMGQMLADGVLDARDAPHAVGALDALDELMAQALSLRSCVEQHVLGQGDEAPDAC